MKEDLYEGCNDQNIPDKEFMSIFCNRCRNTSCVRAGWATSTWDKRISTQVDRLLLNPTIVEQRGTKWEGLADIESLKPSGVIEVWGAPQSKEVETLTPQPEPTPKSFQVEVKSEEAIPPSPVIAPIQPIRPPALNTPLPPQIMIGGESIPTQVKQTDDWAVPPKTLKVGGTFKMGEK